MLTVGGDGTFIQASRRLFGRELPMLGINMGTLGYLTEVEVQNVEEAVKQLVEGNYTIEERMMLYGSAAYRNVSVKSINCVCARTNKQWSNPVTSVSGKIYF